MLSFLRSKKVRTRNLSTPGFTVIWQKLVNATIIKYMLPEETIAAISTPIGPGGIGIVRLSGPGAIAIADRLATTKKGPISARPSHTITLAKIIDSHTQDVIDEVLITVMRAPNSYTREDVVEINCHAGAFTMKKILDAALKEGARMAQPGEFTRRAFLAGRIDLTQAQAVISLIQARSEAAARAAARQAEGHVSRKIRALREELVGLAAELEAAVDFVEEDIEPMSAPKISKELKKVACELEELLRKAKLGKFLDEGITAAIVGRPNVGKSSLLNALTMEDKAIVSSHPGTTRDIVEARIQMDGIPIIMKDTAGWRVPLDDIESQGIDRTRRAIQEVDLIILVVDGSERLKPEDKELMGQLRHEERRVTVINKTDLPQKTDVDHLPRYLRKDPIISISAKNGDGLDLLGQLIGSRSGFSKELEGNEAFLTSASQESNLINAKTKLDEASAAQSEGFGEEIMSALVKEAIVGLGEIVGTNVNEEIVRQIFKRFCVGK